MYFRKPTVLALALALALQSGALALFTQNPVIPPEGAPIAQEVEVRTYRDIPYEGQFLAFDSQGDDLTYALVDQPKKGAVEVTGAQFVYTPKVGKTGSDRFTYAATDSQGNVSLPAIVTVVIDKEKSGVTYSDTTPIEGAAAQHLAETGVFVGAKIGDCFQFEPTRTVSRSEYLAMVMEMTGTTIPDVTLTGFCDDETVPTWAKGYVAAGLMEGFVQGVPTAKGMAFIGDCPIRQDEAAAILNRALSLQDVDVETWFDDEAVVETWAAQDVGNLESVQVLRPGNADAMDFSAPLTRGNAAQMLSAALHLQEAQKPGLFDWLK